MKNGNDLDCFKDNLYLVMISCITKANCSLTFIHKYVYHIVLLLIMMTYGVMFYFVK